MNHVPHRNPAELRASLQAPEPRGAATRVAGLRCGTWFMSCSNLIRGRRIHFCYPQSSQSNIWGWIICFAQRISRPYQIRYPGRQICKFANSELTARPRPLVLVGAGNRRPNVQVYDGPTRPSKVWFSRGSRLGGMQVWIYGPRRWLCVCVTRASAKMGGM